MIKSKAINEKLNRLVVTKGKKVKTIRVLLLGQLRDIRVQMESLDRLLATKKKAKTASTAKIRF